ncbi:MAG: HPr family phosphocarrier protein [Erysipelotrichaceae bacterium]
MKSFDYQVVNSLGIHARPAAMLAQACTNYKSSVMIECNGETASGNNVLQILGLHAAKGSTLRFNVDGSDEDACVAEIQEVLKEIAPKEKPVSVLKVAFFGTKDYDRMFFSELSKDKGEGTYNVDITYFVSRLTIESVHLAQGFDAVCIFVNDEAPRPVVEALAKAAFV